MKWYLYKFYYPRIFVNKKNKLILHFKSVILYEMQIKIAYL